MRVSGVMGDGFKGIATAGHRAPTLKPMEKSRLLIVRSYCGDHTDKRIAADQQKEFDE